MSTWSEYQNEIFDWARTPDKTHLMVKACAGAGKTTTIVELFKRIQAEQPDATVQFLAFNKKIAVELQARGVPANTLNSFGFRAVMKAYPRIKLDGNKTRGICKTKGIPYNQFGVVCKTVSLMKAYLFDAENPGDVKVLDLIQSFGLVEGPVDPIFLRKVIGVFKASLEDFTTIDFDDQVCYPHYHGLDVPKTTYLIVDECQDLSPNKLALVRRGVGQHFVCVGDPLQAIYGFCGADSESMDKIEAEFKPKVLRLPVTYRCGKKIVAEAHSMKVAPTDFAAGEMNHDGEVRTIGQMIFEREVKVTDFVLCRNNAPLVTQCFNLIKRGIRCQIVGRDIGAKLIAMVKHIDEQAPTSPHENAIVSFCGKLNKYRERETAKLYAQEREDAAEQLNDQLDCLMVFVDNAATVEEVKTKMTAMFDDEVNPAAVVFSTIHKAKGLEAETVWCLPARGGKKQNAKQAQEEKNLLYVMITRAKKQLNWVV